jgi:hypothetical protein
MAQPEKAISRSPEREKQYHISSLCDMASPVASSSKKLSKTISLFWTGGFDSTYRLIDLLLSGFAVEPIYVTKNIDGRQSIGRERKTMADLRNAIVSTFPEQQNNFRKTVEVNEVLIPETISGYIKRIGFGGKSKTTQWSVDNGFANRVGQPARLGKQYAYLAVLSLLHPRPIEVCVIKGDRAAEYFGDKVIGMGINQRVDPVFFIRPLREPVIIFRKFRLPIIDMSKADMYRDAEQRGFLRLLEQTWTCWKPVKESDLPCGKCPTCKHRQEELRKIYDNT